jgi:hypothetical protein
LSQRRASALTLLPATAAAPPESRRHRAELAASVDGVSFPYWGRRFGWRATGSRTDVVGGRTIRTVFCSDGRGRGVGYAIVAGVPAPLWAGGSVTLLGGTPFRLLTENGTPVVSWLRDGHLCIVSARDVDSATLVRLASWVAHDPLAS